ncbi:MAG: FadR/GntR family transcriptional regulator [bacterium]
MQKEILSNKIVKEIIARIAQGLYKTGEKLPPERKLALELKVSRVPLREALAKLQTLEVLEIKHGSGAIVNSFKSLSLPKELTSDIIGFGSELLEEIIVARKAIEGATVTLASRKRTASDIKKLNKNLEQMKKNPDNIEKFLPADMDFHRNIAIASKNRIFLKLTDLINEQQKYSQIFTAYLSNDQEGAIKFHEQILKAITKQDEKYAKEGIDKHLGDMGKYLNRSKNSRVASK